MNVEPQNQAQDQQQNPSNRPEQRHQGSIQLPKGGGAIRGIDEKFSSNPSNGSGAMSVPITVSAGRAGFTPQLGLAYNSGMGNSAFGFGWDLSLPAITRKTNGELPRYRDHDESASQEIDTFLLSGAEDLVPEFQTDSNGQWLNDAAGRPRPFLYDHSGYRIQRYKPRIEGLFARIERWTKISDTRDVHWRAISKANILSIYGLDDQSRITNPSNPHHIFSWLLCETRDDKGNAILYRYKAEDGVGVRRHQVNERARGDLNDRRRTANRYLKRILYGNRHPLLDASGQRPVFLDPVAIQNQINNAEWLFEVVFDYGEHDPSTPTANDTGAWAFRSDPFSSYRAGFEIRTTRLCQRVLMFHHFEQEASVGRNCLVQSTDFNYTDQLDTPAIDSAVYCFLKTVTLAGYQRKAGGGYSKKTIPPIAFEYSTPQIQHDIEEIDAQSLAHMPAGLGDINQWIDLYGEGTPGILTKLSDAWLYKQNQSPLTQQKVGTTDQHSRVRFASSQTVAIHPNVLMTRGADLLDISGDGLPDVVVLDEIPSGVYRQDPLLGWQPFRAFSDKLNRPGNDPNMRFIDLNGDGLADILITENDTLTWHAALGEAGFAAAQTLTLALDEEQAPRILFADQSQAIYLADLSGDGLTDIVRIRNGEVCYWPNLGYGRFAGKVTMHNAPRFDHDELFKQARIRFADIDGSGTADLIYLHPAGIKIYLNQSGNGWSDAQTLPVFPSVDEISSIVPLDLLGNGTTCLVWSSPSSQHAQRPMRYVNLMGGQKPHLLIRTINNMGAETRVHYAPSTQFYLQDQQAGKPWITRLPFPVHVVEQVERIDHISRSRLVSRYAYHHGYFDGKEQEFHGFGMVEQWDCESFADYVVGVQQIGGTQTLAPELNQPPITTRRWFHTGALINRHLILQQFRGEYYQQTQHLPESTLPIGLSDDELRECLRALKGLPLREEIYSFDGSAEQNHPYSVVENNYDIRWLQPKAQNPHAIFFPVGRESVSLSYERNPIDPRISHEFGLQLDRYGQAQRTCTVVYGRQVIDPLLPAAVSQDQQQYHMTVDETDYTTDINTPDNTNPSASPQYRMCTPYESRSYDLTGVKPLAGLLQWDELNTHISSAALIPYITLADPSLVQKRLISHQRAIFLDNQLSPLPLGQWDSLGLGHRSFKLAFSPDVVAAHFAGHVSDSEFFAAGYVHFSLGSGNTSSDWWIPSGTMIYPTNPQAHFFLPIGSKDASGLETRMTLDAYDLLPIKVVTMQAAWNQSSAENDYRVLSAVSITNANQNRSAVEHDELGMVIKTAVMGKVGSSDGDSLADPTTRMEYALFNWMNLGQPNVVHHFAREQHGASNPRWQESYSYYNGSGAVVMSKMQAHPGKALQINPDGSTQEVDASTRWIGNGRTIFNNKGKPVKRYEPYFSVSHDYEDEQVLREIGVTPIFYYDSAGRNIKTLLPNQTFTQTTFSAWQQTVWDANDTVKRSQWYADLGSPNPDTDAEPTDAAIRSAWLAAKHAETPSIIHSDSLGRSIYVITDYGQGKSSAVRSTSDLTGRYTQLFDQLERKIAHSVVGMGGLPIFNHNAEKGGRWEFRNIRNGLVKMWDEQGRIFRAEYDTLHRPISSFVKPTGQPEILFNYIVYGDQVANAAQLNLLGTTHQVFDQAGMVRVPALDFKGNPTRVERALTKAYKTAPDWTPLAQQTSYTAIQSAANALLDLSEIFAASSTLDALNRPVEVHFPDGTIVKPHYNESNFLASLEAKVRGQGSFVTFLRDQDLDAKGQRQFATYGNDVLRRYFYDPQSFRLTHLVTQHSSSSPSASLQDLHYSYDPVGNITQIRDDAQQTHFFNNAVVNPEHAFEYDATYQLIKSSGREHSSLSHIIADGDFTFINQLPHANSVEAIRRYTEEYEYDLLGNITRLKHRFQTQQGIGSGWTRHFKYAYQDNVLNTTNRLSANSVTGDAEAGPYSATYDYDTYGNMTRMPHLAVMDWDFLDQLQHVDLGGGGHAYYQYGLSGQRLRKVIERTGNMILEWIYIGSIAIFRRRRKDNHALTFERWTVHINDNAGNIAQVDTKTIDVDQSDPSNPLQQALIRYQYANHLGSAVLETDAGGQLISYEEYHPFGTSAYRFAKQGVDLSLKRFRFCGQERDDETGLFYVGARYYAAWLCRWTSSDPAGFADGTNQFCYCHNAPITYTDPSGTQAAIPFSGFTGRESYEDLQTFARNNHAVITDPNFTPENMSAANRGRFYEANPTRPDGTGGYWRFSVRSMTEEELHPVTPPEEPIASMPPPTSSSAATPPPPPTTGGSSAPPPTGGGGSGSGSGEDRSFWSRGGSVVVMGGVLLAAGAFTVLTAGAGTPVLLLAMGYMGVAGGAIMVGGGGSLLNESYSGRTSAAEDRAVSETLHDVGAVSSPFGMAGGAIGYAVDGREGMRTGAMIGNVTHIGHGIARFGISRLGSGTSMALSADPVVANAVTNIEYAASITPGTTTMVAHGGPGIIQTSAGIIPIGELAPAINATSSGRVVVFACSVGGDAPAVQTLANATGRSIRAFSTPVGSGNTTILNGVEYWNAASSASEAATFIDVAPQYLSPYLNFTPNVVAPAAAAASGASR